MTTIHGEPARSTVTVGIAGCGAIAFYKHLPSLRKLPQVRNSALYDRNRFKAENARRDFGDDSTRVYDAFEHLIADERIDVVHVCTNNGSHASMTIAALEADKHVMCEKPIDYVQPNPCALTVGIACVALAILLWLVYAKAVFQKKLLKNGKIKKRIGKKSSKLIGSIRLFVLASIVLLLTITQALLVHLSMMMDKLVPQLLSDQGRGLRILYRQPSSQVSVFCIHGEVSVDESSLR